MRVRGVYKAVTERRVSETAEAVEKSAISAVARMAGRAIVCAIPTAVAETNGPPVRTIGLRSGPSGRSGAMGGVASVSPTSRFKTRALANLGRASGRETVPTRPSGRGGPILGQIGGEKRGAENCCASSLITPISSGRVTTESGNVSASATASRVVVYGPIGQKSTSIKSTGHQQQ